MARFARFGLFGGLLALLCLPAQGGVIFFTDWASFAAAAPGLPVEDFEEGMVDPGWVSGCPSPLDSTTDNFCFPSGSILAGIQFASSDNPLEGLALTGDGFAGIVSKAIFANYYVDTLIISLTSPASAIGFDAYNYGGTGLSIQVYDTEGGLLGSTTIPAGFPGATFFGVISDSGPIGRVTLDGSGGAEGVDNVAFGLANAVPEPGTVALLGAGLMGLLVWRRRAAR